MCIKQILLASEKMLNKVFKIKKHEVLLALGEKFWTMRAVARWFFMRAFRK